jgi:mono/diheme cytochrome c family protein
MENRSMTQWKTICCSATTALLLALGGCGGGDAATDGEGDATGGDTTTGGETTNGEATGGEATGGETTAPTAGTASPEVIAAGGERFEAVCGLCHGATGDDGDAPTVRDIHWSAERMRAQIRNGSGRMRPISAARLSDEDMEKVLAWMGTIGGVR